MAAVQGIEMADIDSELKLRVKTADGSGEIEIATSPNETVLDLKNRIAEIMGLSPEKYLRLIFGGKLLDPPESSIGSYKMLKSGSFIHAVISNRSATIAATSNHSTSPPPLASGANYRGLDALLLSNPATGRPGLSTADITTMRSVYHVPIQQFASVHMTRNEGESNDDFRYRCETEWMAAQDYHSEYQTNLRAISMFRVGQLETSESLTAGESRRGTGGVYEAAEQGTARDFVFGFFLGLGFGFMMIFCIWDRNISQRQKIGILVGILCQGFMGSFQNRPQREGATGGTVHQGGGGHHQSGSAGVGSSGSGAAAGVSSAISGVTSVPVGRGMGP